ncbi:MAG: S41 family peptidase [Pirellulaceae bacterium]|nr:S41 family peptidase [Planctomycetales bacterium]
MPARNLTIIFITAIVSLACYHRAARSRYATTVADTIGLISDQYVEPVSERELFENAMKGMAGRLDPYSDFIGPSEYSQLQEDLEQEFGGVGIVVELDPKTNRLTVLSPLVDTPAYRAGMRSGDVILKIDNEDTTDFTLMDAVDRMRGKPDTDVTLTVQHADEADSQDYVIRRAIIPIESVLGDSRDDDSRWRYFLEDHPDIAYIRLISFGDDSERELGNVLSNLPDDTIGVILDLRDNPGGLLPTAVNICDMFVEHGNIVSTRGRDGVIERSFEAHAGDERLPDNIPMVVLIDHYSASASEILSACLQDHGRAVIVGERSWGKGTVQNVFEMEGGRSALKLTTATYWRPSGKNIHRGRDATDDDEWGVSPDEGFEVKLTEEEFIERLKHRRDRDVSRDTTPAEASNEIGDETTTDTTDQAADTSPDEPDSDRSNAEAESTEQQQQKPSGPFVDRQLQRAVEYLLEQ